MKNCCEKGGCGCKTDFQKCAAKKEEAAPAKTCCAPKKDAAAPKCCG